MSTLIIWVMGAALLLINIMLRTRILRLEARLKELSRPEDYLRFLRQQAVQKEKVPAIKIADKINCLIFIVIKIYRLMFLLFIRDKE